MDSLPMTASFNFSLTELPDCSCDKGKLLPVTCNGFVAKRSALLKRLDLPVL